MGSWSRSFLNIYGESVGYREDTKGRYEPEGDIHSLLSESTSNSAFVPGAGVTQYLDVPVPAFMWRISTTDSTSRAYLSRVGDCCQCCCCGVGESSGQILLARLHKRSKTAHREKGPMSFLRGLKIWYGNALQKVLILFTKATSLYSSSSVALLKLDSQFSLARAASLNRQGAKSKFPSVI